MDKDFGVKRDGSTLTVMLGMELSAFNSPALISEMGNYYGKGIEKVVFNASGLAYLASAGVRAVMFAHQKLGRQTEIVFVNCASEIKEVLDYVGLSKNIKFEESREMRREYRREEKQKGTKAAELKAKTKERKEIVDNFKAHNDIVCYNMKIGQEDD